VGVLTPATILYFVAEVAQVEVLPYRRPWLKLDYGFIHLRHHRLSPAVELFMELARNIESELAQRNRDLMKQIFSDS
jgi:hypothetical protein